MEETDQKPDNSESKKESKKDKGGKKDLIKKILAILLALLLLLAASYGGYWYKGQQAKKESDEKQQQIDKLEEEKKKTEEELAAEKSKKSSDSDSESSATKTKPSESDLENIEASITSGNTAALEGYMASKVNVIMAATECCGSRTPAQAIGDLQYIEAGTDPWNFSLPAATIASYQAGYYSSYFPADALVGKSANDYVVSFTFDSNGDIDGIFMAINADLLV